MSLLDLSVDEVLSTTRSVRKRLDFSRPVEIEVIRECLELAVQAPTGGNGQGWHFVVVTDKEQRQALGDIYRKGWEIYQKQMADQAHSITNLAPEQIAVIPRLRSSAQYLADHMHEAPVLLVPCFRGRLDGQPTVGQASGWGSIIQATWSFMLAARSRGLGTCWTTLHLIFEQEAADVLGIPYEQITQAALIPTAYTLGTDFKPATRIPLESVVHWDRW